jgi:hypothetical protein
VPSLTACSKDVAITYPGNNVVRFPWRSCGMACSNAFAELEESHDATGKECEDLVAHPEGSGGTDDRVTAAALYDSGVLLLLRGKPDEASERFARAHALDPGADYGDQQQVAAETNQKYPLPPPAPAAPASAAPVEAPAPSAAPAASTPPTP